MAPPHFPLEHCSLLAGLHQYGVAHSVMFRTNSIINPAAPFFSSIASAMANLMRVADSITGLRLAVLGSDVTIPQAWAAVNGTVANTAAIADDPESVFVSLPFRDVVAGRKGRYDFYLPVNIIPLDANNRIPDNTVTQLDALSTAVFNRTQEGGGVPFLVSIGNNPTIINTYFNRAKSGYWQRKQRRTG